jgi:hypothetical protein
MGHTSHQPAPGSAPNTADTPVSVALSMEEVYILLRLLHARSIPGLDLTPFELDARGIPSEPARRALAAATNGLIARGVLEPEFPARTDASKGGTSEEAAPRKLEAPAEVIALLGACAFGSYTLRIVTLSRAREVNVYLHELQRVGVAHTIPVAGIHLFTGLRGREGVLHEVRALLGLREQSAVGGAALTIPEPALFAARDAALIGRNAVSSQLLQGAGVPRPIASAFAGAMSDGQSLGAATLAWRAGNGTERERQFAFVVGQSTCYLLTQTEASAGLYHVQALSAAGLLNYVQAQLQSMDQETIGTSGA